MPCPQCGSRTEVNEKRGSFRDRRCTNAACRHDFTTREIVITHLEESRMCARTRATQTEAPARKKVRSASRRSLAVPSALVPAAGGSQEPPPGSPPRACGTAGSTPCLSRCEHPDPGKGACGAHEEYRQMETRA